jgi:hypothetical protein
MQDIRLTITLERPAQEAFDFTLNPNNTPKWIDGIVREQSSETPTKLGTIYKSQGRDGNWRELEVTEYEPGAIFTMHEKGSSVHVRYTFRPLGDEQCELEYYVWVDSGELVEPFTPKNLQNILQKLKDVIEVPEQN